MRNNPNEKVEFFFSKEDKLMANKLMKINSKLFAIREVHIKP